jgi:hypothetical protein
MRWPLVNVDAFGTSRDMPEIRCWLCEFDPYLCAAFVTQTKAGYTSAPLCPILGILDH